MQHSCIPSCILTYVLAGGQAPTLQGVSLGALGPGDQLTHSYADLCKPVRQRQLGLQETYNFTCTCARCLEQLAVYEVAGAVLTEQETVFVGSLDASNPLNLRETLCGMDKYTSRPHALVEILLGHASGPFQFEKYTETCRAFEAALSDGRLDECIRLCRLIISFLLLTLLHVPCHPLLGLQLFTLGDLCGMLGKEQPVDASRKASLIAEATAYYSWCNEVLEKTHPPGGELLQRLRAAQSDLRKEY